MTVLAPVTVSVCRDGVTELGGKQQECFHYRLHMVTRERALCSLGTQGSELEEGFLQLGI